MKSGVGKNSGGSSGPAPVPPSTPAAPPRTPHSLRLPQPVPAFPHPSRRGRLVPPGRTSNQPGGPGSPTYPSTSRSPSSPPPTGSSAGLPLGALLKEVVSGLGSVTAPPALRGGPLLCPVEVLPGQAVARLDLVEPRSEPLGAACHRGIWRFGMRYFDLEVRPPAHWRTSAHFLLEVSRLRFARDGGRGISRTSDRSS